MCIRDRRYTCPVRTGSDARSSCFSLRVTIVYVQAVKGQEWNSPKLVKGIFNVLVLQCILWSVVSNVWSDRNRGVSRDVLREGKGNETFGSRRKRFDGDRVGLFERENVAILIKLQVLWRINGTLTKNARFETGIVPLPLFISGDTKQWDCICIT